MARFYERLSGGTDALLGEADGGLFRLLGKLAVPEEEAEGNEMPDAKHAICNHLRIDRGGLAASGRFRLGTAVGLGQHRVEAPVGDLVDPVALLDDSVDVPVRAGEIEEGREAELLGLGVAAGDGAGLQRQAAKSLAEGVDEVEEDLLLA